MAKCIASTDLATVQDTYLYSLAQNSDTFATISSDDKLHLFNRSLKSIAACKPHDGISCLTAFGNGFATAGRDGVVRCWDTRAKKAGVEIVEPLSRGFSSIAAHDRFIATGTESTKEGLGDVSVLLYDTRSPSTPLRNYSESHTDTITQLAFHPDQPNMLLSGSMDGLISIFDINIEDEQDALQQVLNPRSAVHCAGFLNSTEVYVVTTDEYFSVYSLSETSDSGVLNIGDVREQLEGCSYVVNTILGRQPMMAFGHNVNSTLSLVQLESRTGWSFGPVIDLPGAHGEEVVRDVLLFDGGKRAMSCGEDAHVKVWDLTKAVSEGDDAMDVD